MPKKNINRTKGYARFLRSVPFLVCIAIILAVMAMVVRSLHNKIAPAPGASGLELRTITIGSVKLTVEVAANAAEQQHGLSDRSSLAADSGMLFPILDPNQTGFGMKDMKFPLDFIYFDQSRVVETKENVPTALVPLPFFPKEAVDAVLEVNAGWVAHTASRSAT